jgi:hypothetical protein
MSGNPLVLPVILGCARSRLRVPPRSGHKACGAAALPNAVSSRSNDQKGV